MGHRKAIDVDDEQLAALIDLVDAGPVSVEEAAEAFKGARRDLVERHLETLAIMGEIQRTEDGVFHAVRSPVLAAG